MFTMKFLWSGPCSYLSDIDDNSKFITRNVRILAYFLSGFCQDCQDIWYPFGSGHHDYDKIGLRHDTRLLYKILMYKKMGLQRPEF